MSAKAGLSAITKKKTIHQHASRGHGKGDKIMEHSQSIANLATALSQFQANVPSVSFDSVNPFLNNKYASLGALIETARPVLQEYGLSVSQIVVSYDHLVGVETILMHTSGEWVSNVATLPAHEEKGKSSAQVAGSIVTYLRRYSYAAILGLYAEEDNDGNAPAQQKPQSRQPKKKSDEASTDWNWKQFWPWTKDDLNLTPREVHEVLGVESVKEFADTKEVAIELLKAYAAKKREQETEQFFDEAEQ